MLARTEDRKKTRLTSTQRNTERLNFHHSNLIVEGIVSIAEFLSLTQVEELQEVFLVDKQLTQINDQHDIRTGKQSSHRILGFVKLFGSVTLISILIMTAIVGTIYFQAIKVMFINCRQVIQRYGKKYKATNIIEMNRLESAAHMLEIQPTFNMRSTNENELSYFQRINEN